MQHCDSLGVLPCSYTLARTTPLPPQLDLVYTRSRVLYQKETEKAAAAKAVADQRQRAKHKPRLQPNAPASRFMPYRQFVLALQCLADEHLIQLGLDEKQAAKAYAAAAAAEAEAAAAEAKEARRRADKTGLNLFSDDEEGLFDNPYTNEFKLGDSRTERRRKEAATLKPRQRLALSRVVATTLMQVNHNGSAHHLVCGSGLEPPASAPEHVCALGTPGAVQAVAAVALLRGHALRTHRHGFRAVSECTKASVWCKCRGA